MEFLTKAFSSAVSYFRASSPDAKKAIAHDLLAAVITYVVHDLQQQVEPSTESTPPTAPAN